MKKPRVMSIVLSLLGVGMISIAVGLQNDDLYSKKTNNIKHEKVDVKNMASSKRKIKTTEENIENKTEESVEEVVMEQAPTSLVAQTPVIPPRVEVYGGLTLEELSAKLDRNLNSLLSGKGTLIATRCIELGVDPYIAVAIMLHETGCSYSCSALVRNCNNVGGQKGTPSCSGSYKGYSTLDEGIIGFIDNLYNNYYIKGLTSIDTIGPRYAESTTWTSKIHNYVNKITNS